VIELEKLVPKRGEETVGMGKKGGYRDGESATSLARKERYELNEGGRYEINNNRGDNYRDDFREERTRNHR
jgi:hypothetical protein